MMSPTRNGSRPLCRRGRSALKRRWSRAATASHGGSVEELVAPETCPTKDDPRIQRQQHRRAVADGRGGNKVAAHRGAIANLTRAEDAQHVTERGEFSRHFFFDFGQRRAVRRLVFADPFGERADPPRGQRRQDQHDDPRDDDLRQDAGTSRDRARNRPGDRLHHAERGDERPDDPDRGLMVAIVH